MTKLPYEKHTLPNGIRFILIPMKGVNSVATAVMVGVGSRYETKKINGVSHFLEHMVFKGTKKYPTSEDVNVIERIGGLQNAYTDIDVTSYHNKVLSTDWRLALEINRELALTPRLEEVYIERERNVILEEIKRGEDEPANKVGETFHQMMYPGTRLGMRIIGEEASLKAAGSTTLREYHDRWYKPESIVVILAGNIGLSASGRTKDVQKQVEEWFSGLNGKRAGGIERVVPDQTRSKLEVVTKPDASQAHLTIGLHTFARASSDRFAWSLFNMIMGIGFTSRLFKEIREKRGLCYHIRSSSDTWADAGYWSIYAGVGTDRVEEATKAIVRELAKAVDRGITTDELAVAKKRLKTIVAFKSEDPEFFVEYYGRQEVFNEPLIALGDYIKKIEKVTKEDINRLLRKYFISRHLNMALVWSKPANTKLVSLLSL
mgnify:FL=1